MERFEDPADPMNGPGHHTGKACIERACQRPAGTAWSPHWCQPCNAARMRRIGNFFKPFRAHFDKPSQEADTP